MLRRADIVSVHPVEALMVGKSWGKGTFGFTRKAQVLKAVQ